MALFVDRKSKDTRIWNNHNYVGDLSELLRLRPKPKNNMQEIKFNADDGNVGLLALDNTKEASIRFCDVDELKDYKVKPTGRHITKIKIQSDILIDDWNKIIAEFRLSTNDILMTSYKGLRKDGMYRRRCDWALAKGVMHHAC